MTSAISESKSHTRLMNGFRERARHVGNTYFQPHPDGWHEFINVERALFEGLVLSRAELPNGEWVKDPGGFFPAIAVTFAVPPKGLPVMVAEASVEASGAILWAEDRLLGTDIDLRFIDYFDFANLDDLRDFRYVQVRVLDSGRSALKGKRAEPVDHRTGEPDPVRAAQERGSRQMAAASEPLTQRTPPVRRLSRPNEKSPGRTEA